MNWKLVIVIVVYRHEHTVQTRGDLLEANIPNTNKS